MVDREKVIKGLECCILEVCDKNCPYWDNGEQCRSIMEADALALLKAQEPITPKFYDGFSFLCGACDRVIAKQYKVCPWCGRAVRWE